MKRSVLKRLLSCTLVAAMVGSLLVGCGSSDEATSTDSTEATVSAGEETDEIVELDLFINMTWYPTDEWSGIIPDELTANGGVTFDIEVAADSSQLGLMIASGELPDIIFTASEVDRLCDSDLCWSYNELIEMYDIDWEPSSDRIAIAQSHNADDDDDNYYTIMQNYSTAEEWEEAYEIGVIPSYATVYYRLDLYEELGSPTLETEDDFIALLKMVQEEYPDMIPFSAGNSGWRFRTQELWYGIVDDYIFDESGDLVYKDTTTNFYDCVASINEMYREGLFPLENLALTNEDDAKQQAISGECFAYDWCIRPNYITELDVATQEYVDGAEWAAFTFVEENETVVTSSAGWAGVFISKDCEDPEAAIKMIAYMNSEEGQQLSMWGREGIDYELDENGLPSFSEEWQEANLSTDTMVSTYNTFYMTTSELIEQYSYYGGVDSEILDMISNNLPEIINDPVISIASPVSTSDMGIIETKVKEVRSSELVKLYTAETVEEFEEAYADYMDVLDQIGVQELNEYMTEQYEIEAAAFDF